MFIIIITSRTQHAGEFRYLAFSTICPPTHPCYMIYVVRMIWSGCVLASCFAFRSALAGGRREDKEERGWGGKGERKINTGSTSKCLILMLSFVRKMYPVYLYYLFEFLRMSTCFFLSVWKNALPPLPPVQNNGFFLSLFEIVFSRLPSCTSANNL